MDWILALVIVGIVAYIVVRRRRRAAATAAPGATDTHHPCPGCDVPVERTATNCPNCKRELPEGWAPAAGIAIPP